MVKKAKVFKPGDYVFAKVKGYPAWPAKVMQLNGKKYNIHFFGTGETGNLPANDLFDYFEHKSQFLAKAIKRRDYNDGMAEIDGEITDSGITSNNSSKKEADNEETSKSEGDNSVTAANDQSNIVDKSADMNDTMENESQSEMETEDTESTPVAAPLQSSATEDSAEESPQKAADDSAVGSAEEMDLDSSAATTKANTPSQVKGKKNIQPKTPQPPKTPRRAAKQDPMPSKVEAKSPAIDSVSRSGRKIKPKRYLDEETEDPSAPAVGGKKAKIASQLADDDLSSTTSAQLTSTTTGTVTTTASNAASKVSSSKKAVNGDLRKIGGRYQYINQSELTNIQDPFTRDNTDSALGQQQKENILVVFLPNGKPVGLKLFSDRPESFATPAIRLQWENKAAKNYIKLKQQLENGEIKPESILNQFVPDIKLTDDEIAMLKKERDLDIQRNQLNFLRVEAKLLELENQMRSSLSFTGTDPAMGIKCLQQINALEIRPLMLLKHPSILETIKRTRRYVGKGDTATEEEREQFNTQAHEIRKLSEQCFDSFKMMFKVDEGKSFLDMFSMLVLRFKNCIQNMTEMETMEMYEEPPEISQLGAFALTLDENDDETGDKDREKGGTPERILAPTQDNSAPKTPTKKIVESSSKSPKKDKPK